MWKALPEDEKKVYYDKFSILNGEYMAKMIAYKKTDAQSAGLLTLAIYWSVIALTDRSYKHDNTT